jgi:hypothetical protein
VTSGYSPNSNGVNRLPSHAAATTISTCGASRSTYWPGNTHCKSGSLNRTFYELYTCRVGYRMPLDEQVNDMAALSDYSQKLEILLAPYLENPNLTHMLDPALELLGFPYVVRVKNRVSFKPARALPRSHEDVVVKALIRLLPTLLVENGFYRVPELHFSVLCGLTINSRWRHCLASLPGVDRGRLSARCSSGWI